MGGGDAMRVSSSLHHEAIPFAWESISIFLLKKERKKQSSIRDVLEDRKQWKKRPIFHYYLLVLKASCRITAVNVDILLTNIFHFFPLLPALKFKVGSIFVHTGNNAQKESPSERSFFSGKGYIEVRSSRMFVYAYPTT